MQNILGELSSSLFFAHNLYHFHTPTHFSKLKSSQPPDYWAFIAPTPTSFNAIALLV